MTNFSMILHAVDDWMLHVKIRKY